MDETSPTYMHLNLSIASCFRHDRQENAKNDGIALNDCAYAAEQNPISRNE